MRKIGIAICMSVIVSANSMNFDVENGFVGLDRTVFMKVLQFMRNEPAGIRAVMGSCQEIFQRRTQFFFPYVYSRKNFGIPKYSLDSYNAIISDDIVKGNRVLLACVKLGAPWLLQKFESIRSSIAYLARKNAAHDTTTSLPTQTGLYRGPTLSFEKLLESCLTFCLNSILRDMLTVLSDGPRRTRHTDFLRSLIALGVMIRDSSPLAVFPGTRFCTTTIPSVAARLSVVFKTKMKAEDNSELIPDEKETLKTMKYPEVRNLVHQLLPKYDPKRDQKIMRKFFRDLSQSEKK